MLRKVATCVLSTLCLGSIVVSPDLPVIADELSDLDQEFKNIKYMCSGLKGIDNALCRIAGLHLGSQKLYKVSQNTSSAPQKAVNNLGNSCKKIV
ncbi:hypothetical protein MEN41_23510, partial [Dolichospermum sp. ST_con]|nr:hypothetical protein [Dolichospermum sp. ST_con]